MIDVKSLHNGIAICGRDFHGKKVKATIQRIYPSYVLCMKASRTQRAHKLTVVKIEDITSIIEK